MTTYITLTKTSDSKVHDAIQEALNGIDGDLKIELHEQPDDPGAEPGNYILWYHSESHNKVRYYVAPPPGPFTKPVWSYDKKDAAKLSKAAAEIVKARIAKMGYKTPLEIEATVKLGVIQGDKQDAPEQGPFAEPSPDVTAFMRFYGQPEETVEECIEKMEDAGYFDGVINYEIEPLLTSVNPILVGKDNWQVNLEFGSPNECKEWKENEECQKLYVQYASNVEGAKFQQVEPGDVQFKVVSPVTPIKKVTEEEKS